MTKPLILCIEDSVEYAQLIELVLEKNLPGYDFLHTTEASQGLELARKENPALILVDEFMPRMSGSEVIDQIKTDGELKHIPVILLAVGGGPTSSKFEPDAFVLKPFSVTDLLECIHRLLNDVDS